MFTVAEISKEIVRLMENDLVLGKAVGVDNLDTESMKSGGVTKVRRQMQYLGQDDNLDLSSYVEDVVEGTVTVTMDKTWSNKVTLTAQDRTLSFDRYSDMVLKPMARRAAEKVEASIAALYTNFYWFDGSPGTPPATFAAVADAGAIFTDGGNAVGGFALKLLGFPVHVYGGSPVLGTKGDVALIAPGGYLIKDGSPMRVEASPHVYWTSNKTVIRASWNVDGRPWLSDPLTLKDGVTTVSPFVVLN